MGQREQQKFNNIASETYLLIQMVKLTGISICIYDRGKNTLKVYGSDGPKELSEEKIELLRNRFVLEQNEFPIFCAAGDMMILAEIWNKNNPDEWLIAGPVIPGFVGQETFKKIGQKYRWLTDMGFHISICRLEGFVTEVLLLYRMMTGEELTEEDFWDRNKTRSENVQEIPRRVARDIFYRQENYKLHNPHEQELRELESIKCGDVEALKRSMAETYEGEIGILAKNPLRHHKNVAIGNITLASRAAISGGISVEQSFSMADSFIQQVEALNNVPEVEMFKQEAKCAYAQAVHEEHTSGKSDNKNPLIAGVKDYIFSHLHSAIQISDIAQHLHVNADYLSHLFKTQEKISIKRYILQEKIRRSQNLLRYSDYRIQEISFYLGFSSQSHFSRTFQEFVGMSPNEYRKQFSNRERWSTL